MAAGREIVKLVPALENVVGTLSVGIGVATGRAFVATCTPWTA